MKIRHCTNCGKQVDEDDICECLRKKIQQKREQLKKEKVEDVVINVFVINKEDVVVFHVPSKYLDEFNSKDSVESLQEVFEYNKIIVVPSDVSITITKNEE